MAKRRVITIGDDILRKTSRPVAEFGRRIHTLLDDMAETMHAHDGCGLAAPQIGVLRRAVVIDTGNDDYIELINPEIIEYSDDQEASEGCLSIPEKRGFVVRPHKVRVRAQDRNGMAFEHEAEGLAAIAVSHEIDHLDGILYIDKMTRIDDGSESKAESKE